MLLKVGNLNAIESGAAVILRTTNIAPKLPAIEFVKGAGQEASEITSKARSIATLLWSILLLLFIVVVSSSIPVSFLLLCWNAPRAR